MALGKGMKSSNVTRSPERSHRSTTTQPANNNNNNSGGDNNESSNQGKSASTNNSDAITSASKEVKKETLASPSLIATSQHTSSANAYATRFLNREVKVLTQTLGAENQWVEKGDGLVEFNDFTIRVIGYDNNKSKNKETTPESAKEESEMQEKKEEEAELNNGTDKGNGKDSNNNTDNKSELLLEQSEEAEETSDNVLLEDTIETDTAMVGDNCCIVWNSFELQLSICLMFTSESCFRAAWSSLNALQEKQYIPLNIDFLPHTQEPLSSPTITDNRDGKSNSANNNTTKSTRQKDDNASRNPNDSTASNSISASGDNTSTHSTLPYSYYIHDKYDPPLGYIEQYALSLSIIEFRHDLNPALYTNKKTVLTLLELANIPLLEHLLSDDAFPLLLEGLELTNDTNANTFSSSGSNSNSNSGKNKSKQSTTNLNNDERTDRNEGKAHKSSSHLPYDIPEELKRLTLPDALAKLLKQDMRLTYLQKLFEELSVPISNELFSRFYALSHRLRNELFCKLLENDSILTQAREALMTYPPLPPVFNAGQMVNKAKSGELNTSSNSIDSNVESEVAKDTNAHNDTPDGSATKKCKMTDPTWMAKQQIIAHLRFFSSLIASGIAELGKEYTTLIITKIFGNNLLEALSLVAERFAMPAGATGFAYKSLNVNKLNLSGKGKAAGAKGMSNHVFGENININSNHIGNNNTSEDNNDLLDDNDDESNNNISSSDNIGNNQGDIDEDDEDMYDSYSGRAVEGMNSSDSINSNNNNSNNYDNNSNMACFGTNNLNFSFKNSLLPSPSSLATSESSSSSSNITPSSVTTSTLSITTSGGIGVGGMRQTSLAQRNSVVCNANCYSEEVEQELVHLLDVTIVRLNERQEEQIINEIIRSPILADPYKYHGLMTFMVRELLLRTNTSSLRDCNIIRQGQGKEQGQGQPQTLSSWLLSSSIWHNLLQKSTHHKNTEKAEYEHYGLWYNVRLHDAMVGIRNPCLLFHVLGLHDDEGATAGERMMNEENMQKRNEFHQFVITKYLMHVIKGSTQLLALPMSVLDDRYVTSKDGTGSSNNNNVNRSPTTSSSSPPPSQSSEASNRENNLSNELYVKSVPIVQFSNTQSATGSGSFDSNDMYIRHHHHNMSSNNSDNTSVTSAGISNNSFINNKINTSNKVVEELNMHSRLSCDIQARKRKEMFSSASTNYLNEEVTLSSAISSPFIKLLDYLIRLASLDNREILLKMLFHRKSIVWQYIINCWKLACQQSALRAKRRLERFVLQKESLTSTKYNVNNNINTSSNTSYNSGNYNSESKTSKGMESKQKSTALPLIVKPARADVNSANIVTNTEKKDKNNNTNGEGNVEECSLESQHRANLLLFIGNDILCINVRFLRTVLSQCVTHPNMVSDVVLLCYSIPKEPISRDCITNMCRYLTVESDLFGPMLHAFNATGGVRHRSVFHSAVLSVLDLIGKLQPPSEEQFNQKHNTMYDIRNYLMFKYWELIPVQITKIYREAILDETCHRLGHKITFENSISVMSSTICSEVLRSSTKLRFVDEVEAVAGGVDGTVEAASITNLNPEVIANVTNSEIKLMQEQKRRHSSGSQQQQQSNIPPASIENIPTNIMVNNNNNNNNVKAVPDDNKQSTNAAAAIAANNNTEKERGQLNGAAGRRGGNNNNIIINTIKTNKNRSADILTKYSKSLVKPIETNSESQPLTIPISLKEHSTKTTESSAASRVAWERANTTNNTNTTPSSSSDNKNQINITETNTSSRQNSRKHTTGDERSSKTSTSANNINGNHSKIELSGQEKDEFVQNDRKNKIYQATKENTHSKEELSSPPSSSSLTTVAAANGVSNEKKNNTISANDSNKTDNYKNVNTTTTTTSSSDNNSNTENNINKCHDDNTHVKLGFKPITPKTERPAAHRPRSYNTQDGSSVNATAGSVPIELLSRNIKNSDSNTNDKGDINSHYTTTTPSPLSSLRRTSNGTHSPAGDGIPSNSTNSSSNNSNPSAHVALPRLRKKHLASNVNRKSVDKS